MSCFQLIIKSKEQLLQARVNPLLGCLYKQNVPQKGGHSVIWAVFKTSPSDSFQEKVKVVSSLIKSVLTIPDTYQCVLVYFPEVGHCRHTIINQ